MRNILLIPILGLILVLSGCASGHYQQGRRLARDGDNAAAVAQFYQEIEQQPASGRAWRELGVTFFDQGDMARSEEALKQAAAIEADARTHLYLGMVYENQSEDEKALRAYGVALGLEPRGKTRDLLESRTQLLLREQVMKEAQAAVVAENNLTAADLPSNTVGVVAFNGSELSPEMAPLARGMAEFTAQDLGKVGSLRVVDRLKINTIQQELSLSQSEFSDPATAPRIGRLIGGRRIVTGNLIGLGDESFRLTGALVNTQDQSVITPEHADGTLAEFFRVQKQFVFAVIDAMEITLTPEERSAIEEVPTENFLALMAYCRGLGFRDHNQLAAARTEFQGATAIDSGFSQAEAEDRSVSSLLSMGPASAQESLTKFSGEATEESAAELTAVEVGVFQATVVGWGSFVPAGHELYDLGTWATTVPRTRKQANPGVTVRGNLDAQ